MIKNYFKIAWRNLIRNKAFSITNLLGLSIGMTCTIFIFLWVKDELSYNKFQANYKDIYQVMAHRDFNNNIFTDESQVFPLAMALENGFPQVKHATATSYDEGHLFAYGDNKLKKTGYIVAGKYFDVFSWQFIKGSKATAISEPNTIVLTASAAKAFFGNTDPINKVLKLDNNLSVKVTAIVADPPTNATQKFDFIMPYNFSDAYIKKAMTQWVNSSWRVYVLGAPGADMKLVEKAVKSVMRLHNPNDKVSTYFTFPMSKWRLYSDFKDGKNTGGMIEYVRLFTIIAIIILLIACINFMNLSTARSEKRAKEVGIRKTLGSDKKQLLLQFFFESTILSFLAFVISIVAVFVLMPAFNVLVDKQLQLNLLEPEFLTGSFAIIAFTGIVAGSYPAVYLSSFNPVKVLKGTFLAGKAAVLPRRILVVGQFVISILLISATIIVYQQIQHVKDRNIGYNPNNLIQVPSTPSTDKNFLSLKNELTKTGIISSVTRTSSPITDVWWKSPSPDWDGKPAGTNIIFSGLSTDVDFVKTMGVKLLQGRDFSGTPGDSASMILNKAAVEAMRLKNAVGMQMTYGKTKYTVIGVTDNIVMTSPYSPVDPMMTYYNKGGSSEISIRLADGVQPQTAIKYIGSVYKQISPADVFEYQFIDQEFGKKFLTEELISRITNIFAGLAIFICCIGLAGLASFTIEKRFREIGVRKVLGASVRQLLMLISTEFLKLVLIAFVIAVPLTWWLMYNWLQKYSYHIDISIWLFGAVGAIILFLTLVVVSLNTMKAAMANPVKSLRSE